MASIQKRELPPLKGQRTPRVVWRARYRDVAGKEHARHFRRKIDGEKWLVEVSADILTGRYVDPRAGKITFSDYYTDWADRQVWAETTRSLADRAVAVVPFVDMPLAKIRRAHVESWVKSMAVSDGEKKAFAPSTIETRFSYIAMVFRGAVRDKRISESPADGVKLPKKRRADQAMIIPTAEQVRAALDAAPEEYRAMVAMCAFAGLRVGEAAGLQVGDVNFLKRTIHVQRQVQGENIRLAKTVPPKAGSERTIAIPKELCDMLARHISEVGTMDNYFFFRGPSSLIPMSAQQIWRKIRTAAHLPDRYTLHTLRHFYASALIASGCDVVTVQRALGHSSASITLNVYSHLWPTAEDRTRQAAGELMRSVTDSVADPVRTEGSETAVDQASY